MPENRSRQRKKQRSAIGKALAFHDSGRHTILKLFTGFANADFIAWKLMVASAIDNAAAPAAKNIHHDMVTR
jgi:hypothetical protein